MPELYPVIDLHSDLLSFLTHEQGRTVEDPRSRNSIAQMQKGNVAVQTLAIFSPTGPKSLEQGRRQVAACHQLMYKSSDRFAPFFKRDKSQKFASTPIYLIPAIENASAFASESQPLEEVFCQLQEILDILGHLFYITMTWEKENRFGGGNDSDVGLKSDGEQLLQWLSQKGIAIDLSHTCDRFASEIIAFIDKKSLNIPLIASHSNFRAVQNVPRNLPDAIAKEIIRRKGLIGITFFAPFIHSGDPSVLIRHVEYALSLGAESALCFGSDFFCDADFPMLKRKYPNGPAFFEEYGNSSAYPNILQLLEKSLNLSHDMLHNIASRNAQNFLRERLLIPSAIGIN